MKVLTTADVAEAKSILSCNIANKSVEDTLNQNYGIECVPDLCAEIDKSSAFLWVLNSDCEISTEFLCKIIDFVNSINYIVDECNPNINCISSISVDCGITITDIVETTCLLPVNTIQILL